MKKLSIFVIAMLLVVALAVPSFANPFTDVPANHWAYDAVNKLVAAGIVEGYPDGTYKGQNNMTRYEMAMIIARVLDNLEAEREAMAEEIDAAKAGLSTAQAQDVTAIVKALIEKNKPEPVELPEGLTDQQAEEVANLIEALTFEFKAELKNLGANIDAVQADVADVEEALAALGKRVDALENAEPVVSFSGTYSVNFNRTDVDGTPLTADENTTYYYKDPFDPQSGWYDEAEDADTDNEFSGNGDYRLTDEEDYYEEENTLENELDLNVAIKKGELAAELDMVAFNNVFGAGDDDVAYELDSLSGTITTPDFTATIKDGQKVNFKDYLFMEDTEVDGIVVNVGDDVYFVAKKVEEIKDYFADVDGDEDAYGVYERDHLLVGAKKGVDFILPFNVYVGYEYAEDVTGEAFEDADTDDNYVYGGGTVPAADGAEVEKALVAFDTTTNIGGFDVTTDVAFNLGESSNNGHLFRLGATGDLDLFNIAFNYENTEDMVYIEDDDLDATKDGFDVEVGTSFGVVDGSYKYEDYGTVTHTVKASVAEGKVSLAGIAVDGSYELTFDENDGRNEVRKVNASKEIDKLTLTYTYEYDVDNDAYDEEVDMVDNGNNLDYANYASYTDDEKDEFAEEDDDVNTHTFAANYAFTDALTAGVEVELDRAVKDDTGKDVTFEDMETTTTVTARYTTDMLEAGFEKEIDGDLTVDGKVVAPTLTFAGVTVDSQAAFKRNMDTDEQDVEVSVDATKAVSDKLTLTAGYAWADKEIDLDFPGVKTTANAGLEYKITEDLTANANYNFLNFKADSGEEYTVKEATAGVSYAF